MALAATRCRESEALSVQIRASRSIVSDAWMMNHRMTKSNLFQMEGLYQTLTSAGNMFIYREVKFEGNYSCS